MKLTVLVPNESYRRNAGARIRYGRLTTALAAHDVQLELKDIGQFDPSSIDADALLISKCHDARAQLAAIAARRGGLQVGVDLFDDYFSQHHDARLARFRRWLSDLAPSLTFVLTSTRAMADVASQYMPGMPVHLLNDAAPQRRNELNVASGDAIRAKLHRTINEQRLDLAWFGIGDNPYFSVGLSDIAAFGGELASLSRMTGMAIGLTVLTNARSLNAGGLQQLASLPLAVDVHEWSEAAESTLLERSFACVLPVGAQSFSVAKSLNRAITALSSGNQLLSLGYPLYDELQPFIYRDAQALAGDLAKRNLRVSPERREALIRILEECSGPAVEAARLASFISALPIRADEVPGKVALVHGISSTLAINELAQDMGDLTVASPYDLSAIAVNAVAGTVMPLEIEVSVFDQPRRPVVSASQKRKYPKLKRGAAKSKIEDRERAHFDLSSSPFSIQLAFYQAVMERLRMGLEKESAVQQLVLSENSQIPFSDRSGGANS